MDSQITNRKVFSISMVRNESDIIESFVRYHTHIFDGMVILDHCSTDNTLSILQHLKAEGLPVYLGQYNSPDYIQSEIMTNLLSETFRQFKPDIIIPLDADEFLVSQDNSVHPKAILNEMSMSKIHYLKERKYSVHPDDQTEELFIPKRMKHCSVGTQFKVCVPSTVMPYSPIITMGNHDLFLNVPHSFQVDKYISEELELAHFPIRSDEQFKSKAIVGWLSNLTRYNAMKGEAAHWEHWFLELKQDPGRFYKEVLKSDTRLVYSPMNTLFCHSIEMKYTSPEEMDFVKNLIAFSELLAKDYADIKSRMLVLKSGGI